MSIDVGNLVMGIPSNLSNKPFKVYIGSTVIVLRTDHKGRHKMVITTSIDNKIYREPVKYNEKKFVIVDQDKKLNSGNNKNNLMGEVADNN